jgi:hypothetical protein
MASALIGEYAGGHSTGRYHLNRAPVEGSSDRMARTSMTAGDDRGAHLGADGTGGTPGVAGAGDPPPQATAAWTVLR